MKIGFIITRMDEYGGAQVHIRDCATALKSRGYEPMVFSGWPGRVSDYIEHMGVEYHEVEGLVRQISPVKDIKAFFNMREALKKAQPDLVSCHSSKAGLIGRLAAKSLGIPTIFTAHGWAFTDNVPQPNRFIYKCIEKCAGFFSNHIITVSEYDRDIGLKAKIINPKKLTAVHNGMPDIPALNRYEKSITDTLHIVMIARFGAQKDHATLIKALSKVNAQNWRLSLVGGGDNTQVGELVDALELNDKISFMGEREDIADILQSADLYCLISHWEGFPRSILEAMRASLPVIATDIAGVSESVSDNVTGVLVPHENIDVLAQKLDEILKNPRKIYAMGQAGRQRFETEFTFSQMIEKNIQIYKDVLED